MVGRRPIRLGQRIPLAGVPPHINCYLDDDSDAVILLDPVKCMHVALTPNQASDNEAIRNAITLLRCTD